MSLYKRKTTWWVRFTAPDGRRVQRSAQTANKKKALEFHDRLKAEYWDVVKLNQKPSRLWQEAAVRWIGESSHKASIVSDHFHIRWLDTYLRNVTLDMINRDVIDQITQARLSDGVSNATVNRLLELVRAILRRAEREWEWIDRALYIRMLKEPKHRIRWLTREEAVRLLSFLPAHIEAMARFALATGLRKSNVTGLQWSQVDLERRVAWIHADQAKAGRSIGVPLNADAHDVLQSQMGKHSTNVFSYYGRPIKNSNTKAWRKALKKAGIENFRWHDLRHTWASWHIQQGTPLAVLQELGAWESSEMVQRYAHLGQTHLATFANQLSLQSSTSEGSIGTNLVHGTF